MNRYQKLEYLLQNCSSSFIADCSFVREMVAWMDEDNFDRFFKHLCGCWDIEVPGEDED